MKINIIRCRDHAAVGEITANLIAKEIDLNPNLVLGLPTGQTPIPLYQEIRKMYAEGKIDCSNVTTFNLDEYTRRGKGDPDSYYTFMHEQLFDHVPFKKSYLPNAKPENCDSMSDSELFQFLNKNSCPEYDSSIKKEGGIGLQIVGIGSNAHIAFNEPSDTISDETSVVALTAQTIYDNSIKFYDGDYSAVPKTAISMGMGKIMEAKSIILIANGESKAEAIRDAIEGPITPQNPASLLRLHPDVTFIIDEAAAKLLS